MTEIFLESKNSHNIIKLFCDENECVWLNYYYIDSENNETVKEFYTMLEHAFEQAKNRGCLFHTQLVEKNTWLNILKNDARWELNTFHNVIDTGDENIVNIICEIDDAVGCIIDAFMKT